LLRLSLGIFKCNIMDRKTFIRKTAGVLLLAVLAYALLSCSSSSDDSNSQLATIITGDCLANGTISVISNNHGHILTVPKADVIAADWKSYSFTGNADHSHSVMVSSANFTTLKSNLQISVNSTSGDGHTHNATISCA